MNSVNMVCYGSYLVICIKKYEKNKMNKYEYNIFARQINN